MSTDRDSKPTASVMPLPTTRKEPKPASEGKQTAEVIQHPSMSERNVCLKRLPLSGGNEPQPSSEKDKPQRTAGLSKKQLLEKLRNGDIHRDRSKLGRFLCLRPWDAGNADTDDTETD